MEVPTVPYRGPERFGNARSWRASAADAKSKNGAWRLNGREPLGDMVFLQQLA